LAGKPEQTVFYQFFGASVAGLVGQAQEGCQFFARHGEQKGPEILQFSQEQEITGDSRLGVFESQVNQALVQGATNVEISGSLKISPHTVKSHVINIFNKLGVNDRTQAAVQALRHQLI
jgi:DNA-binding NarL/FixJ family response regulator